MEKDNLIYSINFVHTAETLKSLSRAQYDLFCKSNLYIRTILAVIFIVAGMRMIDKWFGPLVLLYGAYLLLSKYMKADYTSRKIVKTIENSGKPFPSSKFDFYDDKLLVYSLDNNSNTLSDTLYYKDIKGMYDDFINFYIFRDNYGGYVVPKVSLSDKTDEFRMFLEKRTNCMVKSKLPPIVRFIRKLNKENK